MKPGGNQVRSYLDLLAPDGTDLEHFVAATEALWLELVADERGPVAVQGPLPNPLVYQHGVVTIRYGVELGLERHRALELTELRERALHLLWR